MNGLKVNHTIYNLGLVTHITLIDGDELKLDFVDGSNSFIQKDKLSLENWSKILKDLGFLK